MNILVSGATGLIGRALIPALTKQGHIIRRLVRKDGGSADVSWNPPSAGPAPALLEGIDAVIHLAGEPIAARWTEAKKRRIRESRVQGTRLLADALARMKAPPKVLLAGSAIGLYGNHGDEMVTEESAAGNDFLAEVCREWEAATGPAQERGIRVVHLRTGIVLSPEGGALAKMLPPFQLGLGGRIGTGRQYMSWIAIDDVVGILAFLLKQENLRGAVNLTAPRPATNAEFTSLLGKVLRRPTLFPMPAPVVRMIFGEMGEAFLLNGARVLPSNLEKAGFRFQFSELEPALRHLLR